MTTVILNGKARYFMAMGEPRDKYKSDEKEWSFEITVDKDAKKAFKSFGTKNRIKVVDDMGEDKEVTKFSRDARQKEDGTGWENAYKVVNEYGEPWDPEVLIGNGSKLTVLVKMYPRTYEGENFHKAEAVEIMVSELVPYEKKSALPYKQREGSDQEWK